MASTMMPPPRTPSPRIKIHRSQSFDSPSSRISVTPIDDSPYSKSANSIISKPLPSYNALKAAEQAMIRHNQSNMVMLHTRMSDESMLSNSSAESMSDVESSPTSESSAFGLFSSGSPDLPSAPSPPQPPLHRASPFNKTPDALPAPSVNLPLGVEIVTPNFEAFQEANSPMYDPWLVRVVLDMFDIRGLDWMNIAEPIERIWGFQTSSAEVLGILSGNGRIRDRVWWD